jgi:hypothetical protein
MMPSLDALQGVLYEKPDNGLTDRRRKYPIDEKRPARLPAVPRVGEYDESTIRKLIERRFDFVDAGTRSGRQYARWYRASEILELIFDGNREDFSRSLSSEAGRVLTKIAKSMPFRAKRVRCGAAEYLAIDLNDVY